MKPREFLSQAQDFACSCTRVQFSIAAMVSPMPPTRLALALLVGCSLLTSVAAQLQVSWPSERRGNAFVHDAERGVSLLFGGMAGTTFLGDTWEYCCGTWVRRSPTHKPRARAEAYVAYDSRRGRVVLFGGHSGAHRFGDTWEWDGQDWREVRPPTAPSPRTSGCAFFDEAIGKLVIFGGSGDRVFDETWLFDGADWSEVETEVQPSPRSACRGAYDPIRQIGVLHGGFPNGSLLNDTWEWHGKGWRRANPLATPGPRADVATTFDPVLGVVLLFGGNSYSLNNDIWAYDATSWVRLPTSAAPFPRQYASMAFDTVEQRCVLFGGSTDDKPRECCEFTGPALCDTWTFDGWQWQPKWFSVTSPRNGRRYAMTPPMTWTDAQQLAQRHGGQLATVRSAEENAWLVQNFYSPAFRMFWIGLSDAAEEGRWTWADGEPSGFTNWSSGQPNDAGGGQDYVGIWNAAGEWADEQNAVHPALVEFPGGPIGSTAPYGTGCGSPALTLRADPASPPALGGTANALLRGVPQGPCAAGIGVEADHWAGFALPLELSAFGAAGCTLYTSADASACWPVVAAGPKTATVSLPIPRALPLLGQSVFVQAWSLAANQAKPTVITSNGLECVLGTRSPGASKTTGTSATRNPTSPPRSP